MVQDVDYSHSCNEILIGSLEFWYSLLNGTVITCQSLNFDDLESYLFSVFHNFQTFVNLVSNIH